MGTQLLTGLVKEEEAGALIETNESKRFELGKATIKDAFKPVDDQESLKTTAETSMGPLDNCQFLLVNELKFYASEIKFTFYNNFQLEFFVLHFSSTQIVMAASN